MRAFGPAVDFNTRYELVRELGEGGFGSVFEAVERQSGRTVALKELVRVSPSALARFKQEFRALQDLHHPNLVLVKELFEHAGRWFIAMELVEGEDLLSWVRPSGFAHNQNGHSFNESRLRRALCDVARGLCALHEHGILHRDLKPANVRVEPTGRAVLLDFGLVTTLDPNIQSTQAGAIGTAAYMAPEQATGEKVGPEADWYALGVCLYEALTGRLPFEALNPIQVLLLKQGPLPRPPSHFAANLPEDLERLCMALLAPQPEQRPTRAEVLRGLEISEEPAFLLEQSTSISLQGLAFAGREAELEHLERAYDRSHQGDLSILLIEGESGMGKSALVDEFLRQHRVRHADTWVLKGRCYENEQVPYKAFDGCIDALAKVLKRAPAAELAETLPPRVGVLGQLFPVLREVKALAQAPMLEVSADPTARRLEAFAALSALLRRLTALRPIVLVIDDLQWADAESFRMLRALVDDAEPPPVLILATVRPRHELEGEVLQQLEGVRNWRVTDALTLHGLPRAQARNLVEHLLGERAPRDWMHMIVEESRGHPLFISTLVQYAASHEIGVKGALTLDAALRARASDLGEDAQALLELIALSGRPCAEEVFSSALGGHRKVESAKKILLARKLIRVRRNDEMVCVHDRIRAVVANGIGGERLPALHRKLARALDRDPSCDASERARHWDAAGERERAANAYEDAAAHALESLAFAQAATFCARALALLDNDDDARRLRLLTQHGNALARCAQSAEAARAYKEAAERAEGETRVRLRIACALHLLQGAHFDEGMRMVRTLLADLGLSLPEGDAGLLTRFGWQRLLVSLRGLKFEIRPASEIPAEERLLLDALSELSFAVGWVRMPAGLLINNVRLRRALALGEPDHIARALGEEGLFRAMQSQNTPEAHRKFWDEVHALVAQRQEPVLIAYEKLMEGTALLMGGLYAQARELLQEAEQILQTRCPGEPWLLTNVRMSLGAALFYASAHGSLRDCSAAWIAQAEERCDRFALTALSGIGAGYTRHLMDDDPDRAITELRTVVAPWPTKTFSLAHLGELVGTSVTLLYRGGSDLHEWFTQHDARLKSAFLLKAGTGKETTLFYQCLAGLAMVAASPPATHPSLLKGVRRNLRHLRRLGMPLSSSLSLLVESQIEAVVGNREVALSLVRRAREELDERAVMYRHSAAYLEDLLGGGAEAKERSNAALEHLRREGWKHPERTLRIWAPVARLLGVRSAAEPRQTTSARHDRYEVLRPIGAGGFGHVVEARDLLTGQRMALKELVRTSPTALSRFKQEFRALQDLHHPNLARLDALFEHQGTWFIAMELIEGQGFLQWVRPQGHCDTQRLRAATVSLIHGLIALHDAGFLHRDLTPSNIRVTDEGRIVLLDFGLMATVDETRDTEPVTVGTLAYIAPEQIQGRELDGRADAYALGVCLFEALIGTLPFDSSNPLQLSRKKLAGLDAAQRDLQPLRDTRVGALCIALLEPDPSRRPSLRHALDMLEQDDARATPSHPTQPEAVFAGREQELAVLDAALHQAMTGTARVVLIEGQSGIGKTALVQEHLRRAKVDAPSALVLRGRCYENEQVPYKAFDGAIDALAKMLRKLSSADCQALLPPRAALLAQMFPVLGSVQAIAQANRRGLPADPTARRLSALVALRALLANIRKTRPVVIAVDDLQWADAESFRLLRALVEDEQTPALLFLFTVRPELELHADVAAHLRSVRSAEAATTVQLGCLSSAEATELTAKLTSAVPTNVVAAIVTESKGHPLFIGELARFAGKALESASNDALTLDTALAMRIRQLPAEARKLLELVALAGRPYGSHVFSRALDRDADLPKVVATLLSQRLLRTGKDRQVECFHDRIRLVTLAVMSARTTLAQQTALARALEVEASTDPAELARLWDAVGNIDAAIAAYERAADAALESLAFVRAERLYARALELAVEGQSGASGRLFEYHGHALARSGRSAEAARAYHSAAACAQGEEAIRLRLAAAQQLLQSTQFEEGLKASRSVLTDLGINMPASDGAAIAQLLWNRMGVRIRGLAVKTVEPSARTSKRKLGLDALLRLSMPVGWVHMLPGASLNARHLNLALSFGEPGHIGQALGHEAAFRAVQDPQDKTHRELLARGRALLVEGGDPALEAFQTFMEGTSAYFRQDFCEARDRLESALDQLQTRCPGEPWLLTNARVTLGGTRALLGEHAMLAVETSAWLEEAREREDRFALALLCGLGKAHHRRLMSDACAEALSEVSAAVATWPNEPLSWAHFGQIWAITDNSIYSGGRTAWDWFAANRKRLAKAPLTRATAIAHLVFLFVAQSALSAASQSGNDAERNTYLRHVSDSARRMRKHKLPLADSFAQLLEAQHLALVGQTAEALEAACKARAGFQERHVVYQYAAHCLEGLLEGGEGGRSKRQAALTFFREQGWLRPDRALAVYGLGGLDALTARYGSL